MTRCMTCHTTTARPVVRAGQGCVGIHPDCVPPPPPPACRRRHDQPRPTQPDVSVRQGSGLVRRRRRRASDGSVLGLLDAVPRAASPHCCRGGPRPVSPTRMPERSARHLCRSPPSASPRRCGRSSAPSNRGGSQGTEVAGERLRLTCGPQVCRISQPGIRGSAPRLSGNTVPIAAVAPR